MRNYIKIDFACIRTFMEPLHERIGNNCSIADWQESAKELNEICKSVDSNEVFNSIIVSSISFIYNSQPLRLSNRLKDDKNLTEDDAEFIRTVRAIARSAAIVALARVRQYIIDNNIGNSDDSGQDDIHLLKSHLLTFVLDYDAGWMNNAEIQLWCMLLTICLHKLVSLKSLAGCTTIIDIFRELGYENHGLTDEVLEQIRHTEFADKYTNDIGYIINFLKKNRMSLTDKRLFIVTDETYTYHMLDLRKILIGNAKDTTKKKDRGVDGNELFVGMIEQANENGQITKHKVFYSKSDRILYCNQNKIRHPIIPDALLVLFMDRMREHAKNDHATDDEMSDARAMQERIAREQATFY